jgi:hypothetical protein
MNKVSGTLTIIPDARKNICSINPGLWIGITTLPLSVADNRISVTRLIGFHT